MPAQALAADTTEKAGDFLQIAIPAIAYGATFYFDDSDGRSQFYKSFGVNILATQVLKQSINAKRPNGGDHSFPSGHTSAAFQGAGFIHARYGLDYAWPAYAAATFVGYSRIDSNAHYLRDVVAGAALGVATSFYFTRNPYQAKSALIVPYIDGKSAGITLSKAL